MGYETVLQSAVGLSRLPPVGDPESLRTLKDAFIQFASQIASQPGSIGMVHPGVSAWAERPELIPLARRLDLRVIGPPARIQYLFGNQLHLLVEAEKLGVPNLIQTSDPMYTVRELEEFLTQSGQKFPFVLRAARGGGSLSSILVRDETFLQAQLPIWFDQLRRSLGEVIFILEKYVEGARQVLVPFVRFRNGRIQLFPASDVSLQSRHRKLIEFCPAHSIEPEAQTLLRKWTAHLIESFDYVGLGHFEFLVDVSRVFLKSGAARLNTGFHLWEEIAGTNALAWQMAAADLQAIHPEAPPEIASRDRSRQGLMVKILCEDSPLLLPRPGTIFESSSPVQSAQDATALQFFQNYKTGEKVDPQDSGSLAHLFAFAESFEQVISLGQSALEKLWFAGSLNTNEKFISELMSHPWVQEGIFHSEFVDDEFLPACHPPQGLAPVLTQAFLDHPFWRTETQASVWFVNDRRVVLDAERSSSWRWVKSPLFWFDQAFPGVSGEIEYSGLIYRICVYPTAQARWNVRVGQWFFSLKSTRAASSLSTAPLGPGARQERRVAKLLALISGRVEALLFREGAVISAHEPALMLESLGVFVPHALPVNIRVTRWSVGANDRVITGQILAEIEILTP